jgi:starch phosphorylase
LFKEFHQLWPEKINNKTNGVTPRRWIHCCNPDLSKIISEKIGPLDDWLSNLQSLTELNAWSTDKDF